MSYGVKRALNQRLCLFLQLIFSYSSGQKYLLGSFIVDFFIIFWPTISSQWDLSKGSADGTQGHETAAC